jgi:tRNA(Ile)-lysidine synthase TilS/MesJ
MPRANRPPKTLLDLRLLVRDALEEHGLGAAGGAGERRAPRVLVGVSGGADSMAQLHAAMPHGPDVARELIVVHVNHCSRGTESDADEVFVRGAAALR